MSLNTAEPGLKTILKTREITYEDKVIGTPTKHLPVKREIMKLTLKSVF